jgi:radical SAM protein with 4Fe4S-binding SPASM domain
MAKFAKQEFGLKPSFSFSLTPRENNDLEPFKFEISADQMSTFFKEYGITHDSLQCGGESYIPCTAGKTLIAVKADGLVTPCVSLMYPAGDLNKQSFIDIWNNSPELAKFRQAGIALIDGCNQCEMNSFCLRCYVNASMLGGNIWGKDPHACKVSTALQKSKRNA